MTQAKAQTGCISQLIRKKKKIANLSDYHTKLSVPQEQELFSLIFCTTSLATTVTINGWADWGEGVLEFQKS